MAARRLAGAFQSLVDVVGGYLTLNLLWLGSVLLIVPAFAGTAAAFRVARSWSRSGGVDPYCGRPFFREMSRTFAQATRIGVVMLAAWSLLAVGVLVLALARPVGEVPAWMLAGLPAAVLAGLTVFVWPVTADYDNPDRLVWRTALVLGLAHPGVLLANAMVIALAIVVVVSVPVAVLVLPAPIIAVSYAMCHRALAKSLERRGVAIDVAMTEEGR